MSKKIQIPNVFRAVTYFFIIDLYYLNNTLKLLAMSQNLLDVRFAIIYKADISRHLHLIFKYD